MAVSVGKCSQLVSVVCYVIVLNVLLGNVHSTAAKSVAAVDGTSGQSHDQGSCMSHWVRVVTANSSSTFPAAVSESLLKGLLLQSHKPKPSLADLDTSYVAGGLGGDEKAALYLKQCLGSSRSSLECVRDSPCLNGGQCVFWTTPSMSRDFVCHCGPGYTGQFCATEIPRCNQNVCGDGATCKPTGDGYMCLCPPLRSGRHCQTTWLSQESFSRVVSFIHKVANGQSTLQNDVKNVANGTAVQVADFLKKLESKVEASLESRLSSLQYTIENEEKERVREVSSLQSSIAVMNSHLIKSVKQLYALNSTVQQHLSLDTSAEKSQQLTTRSLPFTTHPSTAPTTTRPSAAWPPVQPTLTSDAVTLTLPAPVSGFNYQIVRLFPDGRTGVIGTYGASASRRQRFPVEAGQSYRFGLRTQSTSDSSIVSQVASYVSIQAPAALETSPVGSDGIIIFPAALPGQRQFVVRSSKGIITRQSAGARQYRLRLADFNDGQHDIVVETETGVVVRRYRLVIQPPPSLALGGDGVISFPSPISGQRQWVIRSNIDGVITKLSPSTRSYTLRTDRLSVGTHFITAETETGRILQQFIVNIRPAAASAEGGRFSTTDMTARWTVDAASSSAKVTLCTSLEDHWMGFGISNDRLMANSDIITAFMSSSTNQPVVQDRFAPWRSRPAVDSDSQVSDVEVSQENGRTCISFNIPCNSPDTKDVSLQGTRIYLFALGPKQNNDISYHSRGTWLSSGTIRCGQ